ncbi:hypothetical protein FACS1894132_05650 [Clostridia bacterium]|nr:hypothetical protein FACS1894132_05650 [Clostridia bacterium]
MALGLGEGFEKSMKNVEKDIMSAVPTDFDIAANVKNSVLPIAGSFNGVSPNVVVQSDTYLDGRLMSRNASRNLAGFNRSYARAVGVV